MKVPCKLYPLVGCICIKVSCKLYPLVGCNCIKVSCKLYPLVGCICIKVSCKLYTLINGSRCVPQYRKHSLSDTYLSISLSVTYLSIYLPSPRPLHIITLEKNPPKIIQELAGSTRLYPALVWQTPGGIKVGILVRKGRE